MISAIVIAQTREKLFQAAADVEPKLNIDEATIRQFEELRLITSPAMSVVGRVDTGLSGFAAFASPASSNGQTNA